MRCPLSFPASTHNASARVNFHIEEYARAVRLRELHRHWRQEYSIMNNTAAADMIRELDLISKRLISCRLWRFEGREALTPWKPLLNWVTAYAEEMSRIRGKTKDKPTHYGKSKAVEKSGWSTDTSHVIARS
jgi:hypothetical protein